MRAGWDNIRLYELFQGGRRLNSDDVDVDKDLFLEAIAQSKGDDFIQSRRWPAQARPVHKPTVNAQS